MTDADALFLSCTNLPTFGLLGELERRFGMPVLSANQVTMWAAMRAAGVQPQIDDQALFRVAAAGAAAGGSAGTLP